MSRLVARILLSILMFPLATLFFIVCAFTFDTVYSPTSYYENHEVKMFLFAGAMTWPAVIVYWCLIWKSAFPFTRRRIGGAILSAAIALGIGIVVGFTFWGVTKERGTGSFAAFLGAVLTILLWLIGTILAWKETAAERAARIRGSGKSAIACPNCGYNMTGLREPRCPECGSRYTLDELVAAQVRDGTDIG
jgi:DNA-directed RNA polymerase subunit RPC12/RpoP